MVDLETGWKVDFIIRKERKFSRTEFERRQTERLFDARLCFTTPEDVILVKLERAKASDSERQIRDAAGIISSKKDVIDWGYLETWAEELGIQTLLERVKASAI